MDELAHAVAISEAGLPSTSKAEKPATCSDR